MIKKRNVAQEIIEGLAEIKAGGGKRYIVEPPTGVKLIRTKTGLSQSEFAACLNISPRTLQEWEQGRSKPTGAAVSLLNIVNDYPDIFFKRPPQRD
jgi:putative transcriptional regulator